MAQRIAEHWQGHQVTVVTVGGCPEQSYDRARGVNVIRVRPMRRGGTPGTLIATAARATLHVARTGPDLVLSMHVNVSPAAIAMSYVGIPYIQCAHATEMLRRPPLTRIALRRARRIIVLSRYGAELAEAHGARASLLERIEPGVDLPREQKMEKASRPTVVTVGRIDDLHKGHDVMLDAIGLLRGEVPNVQWVVIGDGRLRAALERRAADLGLASNVTFVAAASDRERDEWLARSHVFAMPSRVEPDGSSEGYGIVYLEAGAHGLPVVGGDVAGARDAVRHGDTGLLVDPTAPQDVAAALRTLLKDQPLRERMGEAGRKKASGQTWAGFTRRLEQVAQAAAQERT